MSIVATLPVSGAPLYAPNGAVVAGSMRSAQAAIDVLQQGGMAADAVVAAAWLDAGSGQRAMEVRVGQVSDFKAVGGTQYSVWPDEIPDMLLASGTRSPDELMPALAAELDGSRPRLVAAMAVDHRGQAASLIAAEAETETANFMSWCSGPGFFLMCHSLGSNTAGRSANEVIRLRRAWQSPSETAPGRSVQACLEVQSLDVSTPNCRRDVLIVDLERGLIVACTHPNGPGVAAVY